MRFAFAALIFAAPVFAQNLHPNFPAACGPERVNFRVKHDSTLHTLARPEPGKALVYFIEAIGGDPAFGPSFAIRIGIDGTWVGANGNNSYFSVSVAPGEHHMCANPQSRFWMGRVVELAHFTTVAGKVYYFRTRYTSQGYLFLDALDSDEGNYWIATFPLAVSTPKK